MKRKAGLRYFISSRREAPAFFNTATGAHRGIENKLHWMPDVAFGEDGSTKRAGTAAENFSFISKVALNSHLHYKGKGKINTKITRKTAGWDDDYLKELLSSHL